MQIALRSRSICLSCLPSTSFSRSFCELSGRFHYHLLLKKYCHYFQRTQSLLVLFSKRCKSSIAQNALQKFPLSWHPYLKLIRFDKPTGTLLLFWPCSWSLALAASSGQIIDLWLLALFGLGSFAMRSAGCIINDIWDKDFDSKVERTKLRPLASGELSVVQGICCLFGFLSISFAILLQLNWPSILIGASSLVPVALYPLFKRFTYWPQAALGCTINWGALLGWSAVHGSLNPVAFAVFLGAWNWTMIYDTIYAHQDKRDDVLIGVKSTALKFGDKTKYWLVGFSSLMSACLLTAGYLSEQTWPFYAGIVVCAAHLSWQILFVNLENSTDCLKKFSSNVYLGLFILIAILSGNIVKIWNLDA